MIIAINDNELRYKIIELALLQHHKLYSHGMHGPDVFDCAGFVWYVYYQVLGINLYQNGIGLSTSTKIMTSSFGTITYFDENLISKDLSIIHEGDILFFHRQALKDGEPRCDNKYPGHCGIYLSDNYFIQSSSVKKKVIISNFEKNEYWKSVLVGSKDILSDDEILERIKR